MDDGNASDDMHFNHAPTSDAVQYSFDQLVAAYFPPDSSPPSNHHEQSGDRMLVGQQVRRLPSELPRTPITQ